MNMRRLTVVLSTTALTSAVLLAASGSAVAANRVTWKNAATGRYLSMDTGITGTGTKVVTDERNAGGWVESKNSDGSFTIKYDGFSTGDKCLDSNARGSVYGISCNGGNNQKWFETKTSTGWRLKNKATGRILDSNASGSVYTKPDNGGKYQRWL
ncbi:ricin-type beta-trefoil lectin domain protein [Streptomyces sp. ISL-22]|nr:MULTISPECIES: ricin-type beta-trefoil lectin domain protein [Streptomyces]MBT2416966.1 ricin-type beta-trefoil lectin domain protein [Streptomyces sp. ISL-24]MBT2430660.1 ricin-type beta-trefoil lectin domain protein [Streptomyces sp. ISL-22]